MIFQELSIDRLSFNPFTKIGKEWMLITAGDEQKFNTMTASWGGMGIMWNKKIATVYIRPQRYTREFVDANDLFTISFYGEEYRSVLDICGSRSGRDCDKVSEAGLTPFLIDGTMAFTEAEMVLVCKKQYRQEMKSENFIEKENDEMYYPNKDYHIMYMAEIVKVLVKK